MRKVHAYLVGAPCVQRKFRKHHVFICKKHTVIGAGVFAAFADAALNYAAFLAGKGASIMPSAAAEGLP